MKKAILAFDSASSSCSTAVFIDGKPVAYSAENSGKTHSQTLLPAILSSLKAAETEISDLSEIIVTVGPGSFTGLKIGISTAKGIAFPDDIPCVPISTLEALAYKGFGDGIICATLDARRKMLYCALFLSENGKVTRLTEDGQISAEDAAKAAAEYKKPLWLTGDGSEILAAELEKTGADFTVDPDCKVIDARGMLAAAENKEKISSLRLLPRYLRKPQAEREREERLKGEAK